jgi:enoyl-CoA hydratase/carnithine racemase
LSYELLLYDVADGVATITLNRPDKRNALSRQLWDEIEDALRAADRDPAVRVLILAARGPSFCAGADLSRGMSAEPQAPRDVLYWYESERDGQRRHHLFRGLDKPIIAAVQGHAVAWGLELACMCDFVIASEQAKFGAPAIRHGSMIGTLLPWLVGVQNARYLLFAGDTIDAQEAHRIGLAFRVVPHEQLAHAVRDFARRLALIPPNALRLMKRQIDGQLEMRGMWNALAYGSLAASIGHALRDTAETPDGRSLDDVRREQGLDAFLRARDNPFSDES